MPNHDAGNIKRWLKDVDGWATDDKNYRFLPTGGEGFTLSAEKHSDRTLEVAVVGPFRKPFKLRSPTIPSCGPKGLLVRVQWSDGKISLALNDGPTVDTQDADTPLLFGSTLEWLPSEPGKLYQMAQGFELASHALANNAVCTPWGMREYPMRIVPTIVCEAFSAELYLKCLHFLDHGRAAKTIHSLEQLFGFLAQPSRSRIRQVYSEWEDESHCPIPEDVCRMSFEETLTSCSNAFQQWRYLHESFVPIAWAGSGLVQSFKSVAYERLDAAPINASRTPPTSPIR